ncbi:hypothetical protein CF15_02860 [Pyrodictium occultum]|uniref:Uncharacterized protein n=1 Tax=Pyrodictium occultum TaxID=2309 RepID=A0A0V8RUM5_PYROC|nr:hypothetical protein [Pyrodictium occultum]KSW11765.1 hypothetical protein CF15_02860 [Pyrodictium occultum]
MPQIPAGSVVYLIEHLLSEPGKLREVLSIISGGKCKCMIADMPFTAVLENNGFTVEQVVGVGSIICPPGCGDSGVTVHASTWGYGRLVPGDRTCIVAASEEVAALIRSPGIRVVEVDYEEFFENVVRKGLNGVMVVSKDYGGLEVQERGGICGNLYSHNPLHPAGAVGKPSPSCCIENIYEIVGPRARLINKILSVNDVSIIGEVKGIGEGLILFFNPVRASGYASLAAWLGVMYACGSTAEYM